jgi:hypothetical protein
MIKTTLMILAFLFLPGIIMGTVSAYRAGQRPHRELQDWFRKTHQHLLLRIKKFTHSGKKR